MTPWNHERNFCGFSPETSDQDIWKKKGNQVTWLQRVYSLWKPKPHLLKVELWNSRIHSKQLVKKGLVWVKFPAQNTDVFQILIKRPKWNREVRTVSIYCNWKTKYAAHKWINHSSDFTKKIKFTDFSHPFSNFRFF